MTVSPINQLSDKWNYEILWNGCILASIAHAIMVAHYPDVSNEHSWDEMNYSVQNSQGKRGTVTFESNNIVAAFRNDNIIPRHLTAIDYFVGAPSNVIETARQETLEYLYEEVGGKEAPLVTTVFWGDRNQLFSPDTHTNMLEKGGDLLERQAMNIPSAILSWKEYYEMDEKQTTLLEIIYRKKAAKPKQKIILSSSEISLIGADDKDGLEESEISFNEIGIYWD